MSAFNHFSINPFIILVFSVYTSMSSVHNTINALLSLIITFAIHTTLLQPCLKIILLIATPIINKTMYEYCSSSSNPQHHPVNSYSFLL